MVGVGFWFKVTNMGYGLGLGLELWVKAVRVMIGFRVRVRDVDSTFVSRKLHLLLEC